MSPCYNVSMARREGEGEEVKRKVKKEEEREPYAAQIGDRWAKNGSPSL